MASPYALRLSTTGDLSMSNVLKEVLAANEKYVANFGDKGKLALPPSRRFAILTCMDARLHPSKYAGLSEGDAPVIRNAGGRANDDAIRSLGISYKLFAGDFVPAAGYTGMVCAPPYRLRHRF